VPGSTPSPTLRVLEVAGRVAGPACGRLFAALGHEVIKCELPSGDPLRHQEPLDARGVGHAFVTLNADKRSVVADPSTPAGLARIEGLLGEADVMITDLAPAVAASFGLDIQALRRRWPALVIVSVTGYGLDDPRSEDPCDSLLAESYGGLANMIGEPDRPPLSLGGEQAATAAGFAAFLGASLALAQRDSDGTGDVVDVAICDVAAYIDWKSDVTYAVTSKVPRRSGTVSGRWRILPAADGWVGVIYQPDQWDAMVTLIGDPRLADETWREDATRRADTRWWTAVAEWVTARTKAEIYEAAQRRGLAFGFDVDMAVLADSGQLAARGFLRGSNEAGTPPTGALMHSDRLAWRSGHAPALDPGDAAGWAERTAGAHAKASAERAASTGPPAPLAGVRVIDFGTITAGAATSRLLADYGATVVKVESSDHPDLFREWMPEGMVAAPDARFGTSPMFESNNAGKLGVALDLKSAEGLAELDRLVAGADVVVENFSVGVAERLGIDFGRLHSLNPGLVYLSLSSRGQDGPEARHRSYGSTLDLLSGLASLTGYRDGSPMWSSGEVNYPDQLVSLLGAGLVVHCVERGIRGVHLDLAQLEVVSWTLSDRLAEWRQTRRVPRASGNRRPGRTPHDVYPCRGEDEWVAISCWSGEARQALAALVGIGGQVASDDRWWWEHEDEVDARIADWTSTRAKWECVEQLQAAGVTTAPVQSALERAVDPHFLGRRVYLSEPTRLKGYPVRLGRFEPPLPTPAPRLGEHDPRRVEQDWDEQDRDDRSKVNRGPARSPASLPNSNGGTSWELSTDG
jgi:crotonobetainyl-CoA:carnitine CoA-transferase CaiB-like acyl-CoA transferase